MTTYNTNPDGQSGADITVRVGYKHPDLGVLPIEVWRKRGEWDKINAAGLYAKVYTPSTDQAPEETLEEWRARIACTPWQFRRALNQKNLRGAVTQLLSNADRDTLDGWETAEIFQRMHPMVLAMGTAMTLTDEEMDAVFRLAVTFE